MPILAFLLAAAVLIVLGQIDFGLYETFSAVMTWAVLLPRPAQVVLSIVTSAGMVAFALFVTWLIRASDDPRALCPIRRLLGKPCPAQPAG